MPTGPRGRCRVLSAIAIGCVLLAARSVPASAAVADCLVTNVDTGQASAAIQAAIDAAAPGHHLTVEGTCHGRATISKDLVITGLETDIAGPPTLDADGSGSVVTVLGVAVTIEDLTITGGDTTGNKKYGGGLTNKLGTVTLRDVIVRDNKARQGGAVRNTGTLTMAGASRISGNTRRGVFNRGTLTINGDSSISEHADGVILDGGTLTMNGHSTIHGNWEGVVAGWRFHSDGGTIVMNDRSSIRGHRHGGGVRL
jgi:hypothetical protein